MKVIALLATTLLVLTSSVFANDDEARARNLINSLGCKGCHSFEGSGGAFGPNLDAIGQNVTAEQIRTKLLTPRQGNPDSLMPAYDQLGTEDLDVIARFLASRK